MSSPLVEERTPLQPERMHRYQASVPIQGSLTPSNLGLTDRDGTFCTPMVYVAAYKEHVLLTQAEKKL